MDRSELPQSLGNNRKKVVKDVKDVIKLKMLKMPY